MMRTCCRKVLFAHPPVRSPLAAIGAFVRALNARARRLADSSALGVRCAQGILYPSRYGYRVPCNGRTYARWHQCISGTWSYRWSYSPMRGRHAERN